MRGRGGRLSKNDSSSSLSTARSMPGLIDSTVATCLSLDWYDLDEELARVGDDVGIGEDSLALDDHAGAAGLARGLLGPGPHQVGAAHRGRDLHDRLAQRLFLRVVVVTSGVGDRGVCHCQTNQGQSTVAPAAIALENETVRLCVIALGPPVRVRVS